jgi:hypothetical protein
MNADRAGVGGRVEIRLGDFSSIGESFDRIVSVGMLEHVPRQLCAIFSRSGSVAGARRPRPGARDRLQRAAQRPRSLHPDLHLSRVNSAALGNRASSRRTAC